MNYGLYLSASGVLTNMYRQDVFANNLANANTVGFKRDVPAIQQRAPESIEGHHGFDVGNALLDRLGGGVLAGPQRISFAPSPLEQTGNLLDLALEDPEAFFAVLTDGSNTPALTRDGRLTRNHEGLLVTVAGGHPLLDANDNLIQLSPDAPVEIDNSGRIHQQGAVIAQLQITGVSDLARLVKAGENLFKFDGPQDLRRPADRALVKVGFVEGSGVDPIKALLQLVAATKAITGNGNLIRYHDQLMDRAVNVLGRVG
ncbi:MAG: flagellar hook-basal body protein [Phycisphaeraceae bacterium]